MLGVIQAALAVATGYWSYSESNMPKALEYLNDIENEFGRFDHKGDVTAYKNLLNLINNKIGLINGLKLRPDESENIWLKLVSLAEIAVRTAELKSVDALKLVELRGFKENLLKSSVLNRNGDLIEFFNPKNHKSRKDAFTSFVLHCMQIDMQQHIPGNFPSITKKEMASLLKRFFPNEGNLARWLVEIREMKVKRASQDVLTKETLIILLIKQGRFEVVDCLLEHCGEKLKLDEVISNDSKSIFQLYIEAGQPEGLLKLINTKKININSEVLLSNGRKRHIAFDLLYQIELLHGDRNLRKKYIDVLDALIKRNDCDLELERDVDGDHFLLKLYNASFQIEELKEIFDELREKKANNAKTYGELRLNERKETIAHIALRKKDQELLVDLPEALFSKEDQEGVTPYMIALSSGQEILENIVNQKVKAAPRVKILQEAEAALSNKIDKPDSKEHENDVKILIEAASKNFLEAQSLLNELPVELEAQRNDYNKCVNEAINEMRNIYTLVAAPAPKLEWYIKANKSIEKARSETKQALEGAYESAVGIKLFIAEADKAVQEAEGEMAKATSVPVEYNSLISKAVSKFEASLKAAAELRAAPVGFDLKITEAIKKVEENLKYAAVHKVKGEETVDADKKAEVSTNVKAVKDAVSFLKARAELDSNAINHQEENKEGVNLLMAAAAGGNLELVNKFIDNERFLKATDAQGACVLHYIGSPQVLEALLKKRVDQAELSARFEINKLDLQGCTPLMRAVAAGKLEVVKAFIEAGADVNICGKSGISPLMQACLNKDVAMVKALLASPQVDVNYKMEVDSDGLSAIEMIRYLIEACHLEYSSEPGRNENAAVVLNSMPKAPELYNEERQKLDSIATLLIDHNADKAALTDPNITIEKKKSQFMIFYNVVLRTAFRQSFSSILNLLLLGTKDNPLYTISDTANKLLFTTEANQHLADELFKEIMNKMPGWKYTYPEKPNTTGMGFKIEKRYFLPVLMFNEAAVVSSQGILSFIWENVLSFSRKNSHIVDFDPSKIKLIQRFFPGILKKAESTGKSIKQSSESKESVERRSFRLSVQNSSLTRQQTVALHEELLVYYVQLKEQMEKSFFIFGAKDYLREVALLDREMLEKVNVIYNNKVLENEEARKIAFEDVDRGKHNEKIYMLLKAIKNEDRKKLLNILLLNPAEYQGFVQLIAMIRNRRVIVAVDDYYEIIKFEMELEKKRADILGASRYSLFKKALFKIANGFSALLKFNQSSDECKFDTEGIKTEDLVMSDEVADDRIKLHYSRSLLVWFIEKSTGNNIEVNVRKVSAVLADLLANVSTKIAFVSLSSRMANVIAFFGGVVSVLALPYIVTGTYFVAAGTSVYGAGKIVQYSGVVQSIYKAIASAATQVFGKDNDYKVIETDQDKANIKNLMILNQSNCIMPKALDVDELVTPATRSTIGIVDGSKISHNAWGNVSSLPPIILGLSATVLFGLLAVNEIRQGKAPQIR